MGFPNDNTLEQDALLAQQHHTAQLQDLTAMVTWQDQECLKHEDQINAEDTTCDHFLTHGVTDDEIRAAGRDLATDRHYVPMNV